MSLADSVRSNLGPTFADDLRIRSNEELAELFKLRPDLINPIPADLTTLASRATSAPSLIRAIEGLNLWQLQVLEAASLFEVSFTANEVVELTAKQATTVVEQLVTLGLLYKNGKKFRILAQSATFWVNTSPALDQALRKKSILIHSRRLRMELWNCSNVLCGDHLEEKLVISIRRVG